MNNKFKILIFLLSLNALLILVGFSLWGQKGLPWLILFVLSLDFFTYFFSSHNILSYLPNVREVEGQDPWNLIEMTKPYVKKTRISPPKILILETDIPQAFTLGRNPRNSSLVLTEGLLNNFKHEELKTIIAYQISCITSLETFLYSVVYLLCGLFFSITFFIDSVLNWFVDSRSDTGNFFSHKGHIFTTLCLPFLLVPLRFLIRHSNYYRMDRLTTSYTKDPKMLAQVLWKMESYSSTVPLKLHPKIDHFCIVSTLVPNGWLKVFCSHPSVSERIKKLTGNESV